MQDALVGMGDALGGLKRAIEVCCEQKQQEQAMAAKTRKPSSSGKKASDFQVPGTFAIVYDNRPDATTGDAGEIAKKIADVLVQRKLINAVPVEWKEENDVKNNPDLTRYNGIFILNSLERPWRMTGETLSRFIENNTEVMATFIKPEAKVYLDKKKDAGVNHYGGVIEEAPSLLPNHVIFPIHWEKNKIEKDAENNFYERALQNFVDTAKTMYSTKPRQKKARKFLSQNKQFQFPGKFGIFYIVEDNYKLDEAGKVLERDVKRLVDDLRGNNILDVVPLVVDRERGGISGRGWKNLDGLLHFTLGLDRYALSLSGVEDVLNGLQLKIGVVLGNKGMLGQTFSAPKVKWITGKVVLIPYHVGSSVQMYKLLEENPGYLPSLKKIGEMAKEMMDMKVVVEEPKAEAKRKYKVEGKFAIAVETHFPGETTDRMLALAKKVTDNLKKNKSLDVEIINYNMTEATFSQPLTDFNGVFFFGIAGLRSSDSLGSDIRNYLQENPGIKWRYLLVKDADFYPGDASVGNPTDKTIFIPYVRGTDRLKTDAPNQVYKRGIDLMLEEAEKMKQS